MAAEPPPHLPPEPGRSHEEQENGVAEPSTGDFTANLVAAAAAAAKLYWTVAGTQVRWTGHRLETT